MRLGRPVACRKSYCHRPGADPGFFFLKDGRAIRSSRLGILADRSRRDLLLAQYMRALVLLAAAEFVAYGLTFSLIGVPYGIFLAAIAFPLEFIPMVGASGGGSHHLDGRRIERISASALDSRFLSRIPRFPGLCLVSPPAERRHRTPPFGCYLRVLTGGPIAGITGSFVTVPVLATLRVVYRQLQKRPLDSRLPFPAASLGGFPPPPLR